MTKRNVEPSRSNRTQNSSVFLCEELRSSFVLNTPQCAPEKLHGDALASQCPWYQGPNTGNIKKRCAVHHDVLRQLYLPHVNDTLMTTTPPSAKGLPVGGLATAVPTWRLCSQRLVDGEQLLNRRGCYRTTEGRSLLQRDPDGHRRRPELRLEIATGLALPLTLIGTSRARGIWPSTKPKGTPRHPEPCTPSSWDCR